GHREPEDHVVRDAPRAAPRVADAVRAADDGEPHRRAEGRRARQDPRRARGGVADRMTALVADLSSYLPVLILFGVVAAFATLALVASSFIRPHRPSRPKAEPYESGIEVDPVKRGQRFPVKFYLVAMLFIVFDIETIFLFPWAVQFRRLGVF